MYVDFIAYRDGLRVSVCGDLDENRLFEIVNVTPDLDALPKLVDTIVRWCDDYDLSTELALKLFRRAEERRVGA